MSSNLWLSSFQKAKGIAALRSFSQTITKIVAIFYGEHRFRSLLRQAARDSLEQRNRSGFVIVEVQTTIFNKRSGRTIELIEFEEQKDVRNVLRRNHSIKHFRSFDPNEP